MYRSLLAIALLCTTVTFASAHCQVPCGIYGDQLRFQQMLEDVQTVGKSQTQLQELTSDEVDAQAVNQLARWVTTKEQHAQKIQETVLNYFLAQRIKADNPKYVDQLKASHKVIVTAMKCKQSADPETSDALKKAVFDLYRAYEGKEPDFHSH